MHSMSCMAQCICKAEGFEACMLGSCVRQSWCLAVDMHANQSLQAADELRMILLSLVRLGHACARAEDGI